ncbi:hypothetical protein TNCV_2048191 [Trichonephila clavipes]|nr:hypothetical protein TNCV_2048191 [Trichonephila clavipes]
MNITIKVTASSDVRMMTISEVSIAIIVGYNRYHTPRHGIKEAFDVSSGYNSSCISHILSKLIWCSSGWCIPSQSIFKHALHIFDWKRSGDQAGQGINAI